jgi:hypothetical protein
MKKNELKPFFSGTLLVSLGLITTLTQAVPAYMPQALRECIMQTAEKRISNEWQELCAMVAENRILASDKLVRKAIEDRLNWSDGNDNSSNYLRSYLEGMDQRSMLLTLEGNEARTLFFPIELVASSVENNADMDMVYLSNELATKQNIELCGCADINATALLQELNATRVPTLNQPSLIFNANVLMSPLAPTPNIVLGTGITTALIPAWIMAPSNQVQYPVSMQFPVPDNLRSDRDMEIILHFFATQQNIQAGLFKLRIEGWWTSVGEEFATADMTWVADSADSLIIEPTAPNLLRHVYVNTTLNLTQLERIDFVRLAFTRVAPDNIEYAGDIYLAAIEFRYTAR